MRFALLVSLVWLVASGASAFERSTVTGQPDRPLFWDTRVVHLRTAYDSCDDLLPGAIAEAVARSASSWSTAGEGCSDFRLVDDGYPTGFTTNLIGGGGHDGENRIIWREAGWPDEVSPDTLALTTVVFRRSTGQILDADIDLNGVDHVWTVDAAAARTDAENTLTHELGHLLGLGHVADPEATMYGQSDPGDLEKRTLSEDDVAGLCFVYPAGLASPGAPYVRSPGLTGCRASAGRHARGGPWLFALLTLWWWRRRRGARRGARRGGTASASR